MSTEILNPVTSPSMMYPQLGFGKIKPRKKDYKCIRCNGDSYSRLKAQIYKPNDIIFAFECSNCGNSWLISSKMILNDVFEEQIQRISNFTKQTKKEFGAFIIKTRDGIRLDMIEIGADLEVSFKQSHELKPDEVIVGTWHAHPITDEPSDFDIGTFLRDDFEKICIVSGAKGTINLLAKTPETIKITDVRKWVSENEKLNLKEKGIMYGFLVFRGKVNNLQEITGGSKNPFVSLEGIIKNLD